MRSTNTKGKASILGKNKLANVIMEEDEEDDNLEASIGNSQITKPKKASG